MKVTFNKTNIVLKSPNPDGSFYGLQIEKTCPLFEWFKSMKKNDIIELFNNEVKVINRTFIEYSIVYKKIQHVLPFKYNGYCNLYDCPLIELNNDIKEDRRREILEDKEFKQIKNKITQELYNDKMSIMLKKLRIQCIINELRKN